METIAIIAILMFAVILHECAHGWVAYKLGDPTAKMLGRLTLNPLKHIDPFGTLILPGMLMLLRMMGYNTVMFGWAKPVPVNFLNLRNPKRDMIWVGMAGPAVNVMLAAVFSLLLKEYQLPVQLREILLGGIFINLLLVVFNMLPIPPLDGSRLVAGLLPNALARPYMMLEPYGILIVMLLLSVGVLDVVIFPGVIILAHMLGVEI